MSKYVENNLNRNEQVVSKVKLNPVMIILWWVLFVVALIIGFVVANNIASITIDGIAASDIKEIASGYRTVTSIFVSVVFGIPAIVKTVNFFKTDLVLTNKRVVGRTGVLKLHTLDAPLNKIQNVSFSCGLFGRIFGFQTVKISTAADVFGFKGVMKANEFKQAVMNQIELYEEERAREQAKEFANAMAGVNSVDKN
ncbi:MAG: PH domain-containing protein [Clostridia bacterium]|nr:PH domain-containing protein [Clostridia bacterium]MDE7328845.1 PH domain-containing protein [Clostridia bacterium]